MRSTESLIAAAMLIFTLFATTYSTPSVAVPATKFVSCLYDIKDADEVLVMPDPIIKCGGAAGRAIEHPIDWHAAGHSHDGRFFKVRHFEECYFVTTEYGYIALGGCSWQTVGPSR